MHSYNTKVGREEEDKMIWVPNESQGFEVETFHEALGSKDGNLFLVVFGKLNPQLECLFLLN